MKKTRNPIRAAKTQTLLKINSRSQIYLLFEPGVRSNYSSFRSGRRRAGGGGKAGLASAITQQAGGGQKRIMPPYIVDLTMR